MALDTAAIINPTESLSKGVKAKKIAMTIIQPFTKRVHSCSVEEYNGGMKFRNGDTLVARITPCLENGKTVFVDILDDGEIGFGSTEYIVLREKQGTSDKDFLYYFAISPEFRDVTILSMTGSSGRQRVQTDVVRNHLFSLPPLPEQKAIASVLSSLDDKIDLLHRQNKTLEAMAETLFRQWFVEEAQEDWEWVELGQFVEVMRGLSYKGSGLCSKNSGVPMHNLNSVYEGGGYKYEGIKYYSGDFKERHLVSHGDVIITNTEQGHDLLLIGFPAIMPRFFGDSGIFSQHIYKLIIRDTYISEPFLYYLLMSYDVREQITGATNGSTVNMLPKDGIEWAKFKLPPEPKIMEFTNIVRSYLEKKEFIHSQIRTLEKLRDTLLPKLMSGEVRVVK